MPIHETSQDSVFMPFGSVGAGRFMFVGKREKLRVSRNRQSPQL